MTRDWRRESYGPATTTLLRDIPTPLGTIARGTDVEILGKRDPRRAQSPITVIMKSKLPHAVICIDPPGKHLGRCHNVRVSVALLRPP